MKPLEQFNDKDFGVCKILFRKPDNFEHVCLFASHTFSPTLPEYVYYYLEEIKRSGLSLIFISSSLICDDDHKRLTGLANIIIEKENKGTDFGAWCATLRWLNYGKSFKTLYLCNDSVFGPLSPLLDIHTKFYSVNEDVLGITDSHQGVGYHIQSYFIGLKNNVLKDEVWEKFWAGMTFHKDKQKVIEYYEIGLTRVLRDAGFTCFILIDWCRQIGFPEILLKVSESETLRTKWLNRVLYEQKDIVFDINPSSFFWKELIVRFQSPFIKRELFIYNRLYEEYEIDGEWENIIEQYTSYPAWLIKLFLINHFLCKFFEIKNFKITLLSFENTPFFPTKENSLQEEFFLFAALRLLVKSSPIEMASQLRISLKQLKEANIEYLPLKISSEEEKKSFVCTLLYITHQVAVFDHSFLSSIKTTLKRIANPVIIVPDKGSRSIVSSLLSLKDDGLILEREFLIPSENNKVANFLKSLFTNSHDRNSNLFQRPTLADVVKAATNDENESGLNHNVSYVGAKFNIMNALNENVYNSREDYQQYLNVKNKYFDLYENTPLWYKKAGQVIKVLNGNKRLIVELKDKGKKDKYSPTADDLAHWYYIQYEVLPRWYKKLGKLLIKRKK